MVSIVNGQFTPIPFEQILDPNTNGTRVRNVNVKSESYDIARQYMIRLDPEDFELDERLVPLASIIKLSSREFRERFAYVVEDEKTA